MKLSFFPFVQLIPGAVSAMLADIAYSGQVCEGDRYGLMAACCDETLDEEERLAVNRLIHSIVRGKVEVC
ncbi:MAG: hypothetical protein HC799_08285 [Limnothrix sp. RL_2_0]|nr:hypothetical protein [Limnothrix sp. RL_2_0]